MVVSSLPTTKEAMDELAAMTQKLAIDKKSKRRQAKAAAGGDADMDGERAPKIKISSNGIKKTRRETNRFKKSKKQLLH